VKRGDLVKTGGSGTWWWSQKVGVVIEASPGGLWCRVWIIGSTTTTFSASDRRHHHLSGGGCCVRLRPDEVTVLSAGAML